MDRLIFTAYSGMTNSHLSQRVIASNMANAQTTGFRAETLNFTPMTLKGPQLEARAMTSGEVRGANMKQGAVVETGNALDIAMTGDALMAVQADNGDETYTRRGDLSLSPAGVLQNGEGRPVVGTAGPITVPLGAGVRIAPDGSVLVANPEAPDQPPLPVDRIKLASPQGSRIAKGLDGLFRVQGGGALPGNDEARIIPGALEQSNVDPNAVLVEMIEAQRLFDIRTKVISTARDIDQGGATLMRLT